MRRVGWFGWSAAGIALASVAAVSIYMHRYRDDSTYDSCINRFGNRPMLAPKLDLDLQLPEEQWPELRSLLDQFAQARRVRFVDSNGNIMKDRPKYLDQATNR